MLLQSGNPFKCHEEVLSLQPLIPPKRFDIFPPTGGCSEGLDAFKFFFKLGTDPIAWIASIRFSFSVENNRADAGQDGRTRLARPHYSQVRAGTGKYSFCLFNCSDHEQVVNQLTADTLPNSCPTHISNNFFFAQSSNKVTSP